MEPWGGVGDSSWGRRVWASKMAPPLVLGLNTPFLQVGCWRATLGWKSWVMQPRQAQPQQQNHAVWP